MTQRKLDLAGVNGDLNSQEEYQDLRCARCGESWPITVLNIKAVLDGKAMDFFCLDTEKCERRVGGKPKPPKPKFQRADDVISTDHNPYEDDIPF